VSERQDRRDERHCMEIYGPELVRCAGGRLIVDGYVCPHCGSLDPHRECKKPKKGRKPNP